MKTRILFFFLFLSYSSSVSFSQVSESRILPATAREDTLVITFNTSQATGIIKPVIIGTEISGFFYYNAYPWIETYGVSLALYTGQSISFNKMYHNFAEYSPRYHSFNKNPIDNKYSDSFILFAPGISLYSINRKYSLDLFKKLETQIYTNGKQLIAPLKVNVHF